MAEKKQREYSLRKFIYNDKYLVAISIIAAVIIWVATSMNLSPETAKTITVEVPVDFSDSAAEQLGIKCYGDSTVSVEVTINCKKYLAKDITAENLDVSLQTSAVTTNGFIDVPIKVEPDSSDFEVTSFYPTTYRAYFDVEDSRVMDITVNYMEDDFIEDGYVMDDPKLSETSVTLTGPKTYMSTVVDVVSEVSFENKLTSTQTVDLKITPVDAYGNTVDFITVNSKSKNVTLTIPVLKIAKLDVTTSFTNKPAGAGDDISVSYDVSSVNAGVLEEANIANANIGTIDFSQLKPGENTFTFKVDNLDSIVILDDIKEITATVTVPDSYVTDTLSVTTANVNVANVPDGYKYSVEGLSSYTVTVVGTEDNVSNIKSGDVSFIIDLKDVTEENIKLGVNSYTASVATSESDNCWIYGEYTVRLNLYK